MSAAEAPLLPRHDLDAPAVLLSYQQRLVASTSDPVVLYEKSRRIGISWAAAYAAVETAALKRSDGGMDVLYIGYNLEMARGFVDDCAFWAKHLGAFAGEVPEVQEFLFQDDDPDHSIKAFRIDFGSGFEILALPSRPRSLRSKQGFVILDEAAFYDDLAGVQKAAMALLMWGGRVWIISTHDGADNLFNELVEDCRAKKKPFKLFRTTFDDALNDGLYERIALTAPAGIEIPPKAEWVQQIRDFYGDDAAEELDVIPAQGTGVWLSSAVIKSCMNPHYRVAYLKCPQGFELKPDHERTAFVEAWLENEVAPLLDRLDPNCRSHIGGDFARTADLSCFWPGQIGGSSLALRVPFTIELRNVPFREQELILFYVIDRLPRFTSGALDARGLGATLAEFAMQRYGKERIEQVMATNDWYRDNMPGLKHRFEDGLIEVPLDDDTRQDLRMVRLDKGVPKVPEGRRVRSSRGGWRHGDAAIAAVMLEFAVGMEVAPIDFQSTGAVRAGQEAFQQRPGEGRPRPTESGWGTIGGGNDFTGY